MNSFIDAITKGRKVFFIAPDKTLIPESYLEEYLADGFECYFIDTDIFLSIESKVDIILTVFEDALLFFNIDAPCPNSTWTSVISKFQTKYPRSLFGVLYSKRQSILDKSSLEKTYLMNIGIKCGCIQLEYQKKNNFGLLEKTLYANQAMGRRKNVRAICTTGCRFNFLNEKTNQNITGKLTDISISHFSITLPEGQLVLEDYEKIQDVAISIKGLHLRTDAILFMSRPTEGGQLFVFAFTQTNGFNGLDSLSKQLLVPKLYEIMLENTTALLSRLFATATQKTKVPKIAELMSADAEDNETKQ